ncbi:MAG: hypothetical protein KAT77_06350 [Nanoarchaeota archaeon]|nr:hypothetical protein [Nanoarchaeota archaeon]
MTKIVDSMNGLIRSIRTNNLPHSKKIFSEIIKFEGKITKEITRKVYELGEIFEYSDGSYFVETINESLKKRENYLLRLIRQEIMYNSEDYSWKDRFKANQSDLKKYPQNSEFLNYKGLLYWDDNDLDKALRYLTMICNAKPKNVNFIRNKALILVEMKRYKEAHQLIEHALGLEPDYEKLSADKEYFDLVEYGDNQEERFEKVEKNVKTNANFIKNIKFEFIAIASIFIVILTLVVKIIKFDYVNYQSLNFWQIVKTQVAINSPWLVVILILIIFLASIFFFKK